MEADVGWIQRLGRGRADRGHDRGGEARCGWPIDSRIYQSAHDGASRRRAPPAGPRQ
jgi:hypothetical protein